MFVVEVVAALTTVIFVRDLRPGGDQLCSRSRSSLWLWFTVLFANFAEAVAEGRGKAQADTLRRTAPRPRRSCLTGDDRSDYELVAGAEPQGRRCGAGRGRRHHSLRRRGDRGRRLGQRSGDHRRIGAGDPRIRRRPLGRHRRHPGAVGLDPRAHHGRGRLDLPRPHDRAGRRRRAAEDAERDRAEYPAGRPHHHLRVRGRDHPSYVAYAGGTSRWSCWWRCSSR